MSFSKLGNAAHRSQAIFVLFSLKSFSNVSVLCAFFFSLFICLCVFAPSRSSGLVLIMEMFTVSRAL